MKPALRVLALLACMSPCPAPLALDYQVHGYAAQGFVYTDRNDFFGDSESGSTNYYEAGLNTSIQVRPELLIAAQGAVRDAGISDDSSVRLDYALADYRFASTVSTNAGVRAGKIKNAMGFFNETRDVIFTRPSILLPSVYSDNQNQRSLVFTAPGAQIYGSRALGSHELAFTGTLNADRDVRRSDERLLINLSGLPFDLRIQDSWNAQIMDSLDGGRWQFALSHFFGRFTLTTPANIGLAGVFDVGLTILSGRYNSEKLSLTAEYAYNPNKDVLTLGSTTLLRTRIVADTGYLQGEYRIDPHWATFARLDASYLDRHDRSGREFAAANPGRDRHSRFSHDLTVGLSWRTAYWGVWGEYHWIDGTSHLQALENPDPPRNRWSMLMLMAGFKF